MTWDVINSPPDVLQEVMGNLSAKEGASLWGIFSDSSFSFYQAGDASCETCSGE